MNLAKNKILYADMLNSLLFEGEVLYEDEHALLMRDKFSYIYYCAADRQESAKKMVEFLPNTFDILVSHDTLCNTEIQKKAKLNFENQCYHCAYLSNELLPIELPTNYEIKQLEKEHLIEAINLYKEEMPSLANEEYLGMCMKDGLFGMFEKDTFCGFIGVHEGGYGSIGMLEIKKEYRRRGLGVLLERYAINEQLRKGRIPYGEIFIDNIASLKLQSKVEMEVGKDLTYWFYQ